MIQTSTISQLRLVKLVVTVPFFLSLIFINNAFAAGVVGTGSFGSCTNSTLANALVGGGTVTFKCGSTPATITINEKTIAANTVIDGGNLITLNGANGSRLFSVMLGKNLSVKNMTLTNGHTTGQGAAINGQYLNTLSISNCKFINNVSTQLGEAGGGAIQSQKGIVTIDKSSFTNNRGGLGGAVKLLHSNLTVTASTFIGNKAVDANIGNGGAIYVDGANGDNGTVVITASTFQNNSATSYGGAFFESIGNNNKTTITNSNFLANSVGGGSNGQGGAIWSTGHPARGDDWTIYANNTLLNIVNTTFADNTASMQGGAIWSAQHPKGAVISNSAIYRNKTLNSMGGGIVQGDTGKLFLINSTVSDNRVSGTYAMGGGIYIGRTATASITNTTIANNTASWQAGGIFGMANVTLKNTILANNIALNGGNNWNIKHNCFQQMIDGGNNLQFPIPIDADCTQGILIADPKLDVLKNNGGLTLSRTLLPGSAASRHASGCPANDQRGAIRSNPAGTLCDIGAIEVGF